MADRKSTGDRGSLMDLGKPRLGQTPLAAPLEEVERRLMATASSPSVSATLPQHSEPLASVVVEAAEGIQTPVQTAVQTFDQIPERADLLSRLRKDRQPIAVVGFKLPAALKEELLVVAQHNRTDMTRLVVAALERLLPELPHPPGWKKPTR
jgi:hypothetical protein